MSDPKSSHRDRRDLARQKAREHREARRRNEKRRRLLLQGGIGAAIIAAVVIIALVLVNAAAPAGPGPKNMADDGIIIGKGLIAQRTGSSSAGATPSQRPVQKGIIAIRAYEDFQCSACLSFENANAAYIKTLLVSGQATLQVYPVAILDSMSQGNLYSTRAANAAACVSNFSPDQFYEFHRLLYAHQPPENGTGMTDAQLTDYANDAAVTNLSAITKCIANQTFSKWVGVVTERFSKPTLPDSDATNRSVNPQVNRIATPTVIVNGKLYRGSVADATAFKAFVLSASQSYTASPTPTPSPTATATAKG